MAAGDGAVQDVTPLLRSGTQAGLVEPCLGDALVAVEPDHPAPGRHPDRRPGLVEGDRRGGVVAVQFGDRCLQGGPGVLGEHAVAESPSEEPGAVAELQEPGHLPGKQSVPLRGKQGAGGAEPVEGREHRRRLVHGRTEPRTEHRAAALVGQQDLRIFPEQPDKSGKTRMGERAAGQMGQLRAVLAVHPAVEPGGKQLLRHVSARLEQRVAQFRGGGVPEPYRHSGQGQRANQTAESVPVGVLPAGIHEPPQPCDGVTVPGAELVRDSGGLDQVEPGVGFDLGGVQVEKRRTNLRILSCQIDEPVTVGPPEILRRPGQVCGFEEVTQQTVLDRDPVRSRRIDQAPDIGCEPRIRRYPDPGAVNNQPDEVVQGLTGGATLQQGGSLDRQLSGAEGTERGELPENSAVMLLVNGQAVDLLCLAGLGEQLSHHGELFVVERDPGALLEERGNETWIGDAEFGGFVQEEVAGESGFLLHQLIGSFKAGDEIRGKGLRGQGGHVGAFPVSPSSRRIDRIGWPNCT